MTANNNENILGNIINKSSKSILHVMKAIIYLHIKQNFTISCFMNVESITVDLFVSS